MYFQRRYHFEIVSSYVPMFTEQKNVNIEHEQFLKEKPFGDMLDKNVLRKRSQAFGTAEDGRSRLDSTFAMQ